MSELENYVLELNLLENAIEMLNYTSRLWKKENRYCSSRLTVCALVFSSE